MQKIFKHLTECSSGKSQIMRIKTLTGIFFFIGINLLIPAKTIACPIPVFRYALEFWEADSYRLEIFYKNSLGSGEKELVNYLLTVTVENEVKSNFIMRTVNVGGDDHDIPESILKELPPEGGALMVLRYPFMSGINSVLWSAPLNRENIDLLLNSPVRESIANKLISDATAVWVFLESGDRRKDRDALDLLNRELRRLEQTLTLPDLGLWIGDYQNNSDENDPKIKFEIVKVSRDDPGEALLVKMLMNTEHYLDQFELEPIVFPVYGRGIALWAIIGNRINEYNITGAAEFLTGPCSCQVKSLNPGSDLLISMDWDNLVDNIADISLVNPLSGMGDFSSRETEVRRQLESATLERLETTSGAVREDTGTDFDSFSANEKLPGHEVPAYSKLPEEKSETVSIDQYNGNIDIKYLFGLILAGIIALVVSGSIILYWKRIK